MKVYPRIVLVLFFAHKYLYNSRMNQKYPYCFLGRNKDMS